MFWSILWFLWLRRNKWVFERKKEEYCRVIDKVMLSVEEYNKNLEDNPAKESDNDIGREGWQPPKEGMIKLNSDAAVFPDGRVGCGGVMRDYRGAVLGTTCLVVEGYYDIDVAEAFAARQAMQVSLDGGMNRLIMESDCLKLISHLKRGVIESSSFGFLVADILDLSKQCLFFSCQHVKRVGNQVAHKLAHISKGFSVRKVWLGEASREVNSLVMADIE